jgi:DNA replication and repair protein RecF
LAATRLAVRNFRNYEQAEVDLADGVTLVHGPVGAGKTNLLEALCFACTGRSPRTASDRDLIRFGERAAYASFASFNGGFKRTFEAGVEVGRSKLVKVDGVKAGGTADLDGRPLLRVFLPDHLELVKGPAAIRRPYLDGIVAGLWPARRATRVSYARALAQRNVLVGRARASGSTPNSLAGWNRELARWGIELMGDRARAVELLAPWVRDHAARLGFAEDAAVGYRPRSAASTAEELEAELETAVAKDLERGFTTHGPHRDDLRLEAGGRDIRRFGSQGQQRLALLSLLLAERDALAQTRESTPILLLDDVLSELDDERRRRLLGVLEGGGLTLITTADAASAQAVHQGLAEVRVNNGRLDA